jgi:hypothetical protein
MLEKTFPNNRHKFAILLCIREPALEEARVSGKEDGCKDLVLL